MIGGLIETSTIWKKYQDKLDAAGIPWIAISLPGFDGRPESGNKFTAEKSISAVLEKLELLGKSKEAGCTEKVKTILIGNSLGANVAFDVAGKAIPGLEIAETHLLSPAINPYDNQLKAPALYYKKLLSSLKGLAEKTLGIMPVKIFYLLPNWLFTNFQSNSI